MTAGSGAGPVGLEGMVEKLSLKPDSSSGHFSRKVKRVLKLRRAERVYRVAVPGHSKSEMGRVVHSMPVIPPYESLHREAVGRPEMKDALAGAVARNELPPAYMDHPVQ